MKKIQRNPIGWWRGTSAALPMKAGNRGLHYRKGYGTITKGQPIEAAEKALGRKTYQKERAPKEA